MVRNTSATRTWVIVLVLFWYFSDAPSSMALEWVQHANLTADDPALGDSFGTSVSISGVTAIIGAPWDGDENSGSAYIFQQSDSGWTQVATLMPSDGGADDLFGYRVSISGDTAIVGVSPDEDVYGDSGWAYVFADEGSGWTQVAKLPQRRGSFGRSVAIDGRTVIAGTPDRAGTARRPFPTAWNSRTRLTKLYVSVSAAKRRPAAPRMPYPTGQEWRVPAWPGRSRSRCRPSLPKPRSTR